MQISHQQNLIFRSVGSELRAEGTCRVGSFGRSYIYIFFFILCASSVLRGTSTCVGRNDFEDPATLGHFVLLAPTSVNILASYVTRNVHRMHIRACIKQDRVKVRRRGSKTSSPSFVL